MADKALQRPADTGSDPYPEAPFLADGADAPDEARAVWAQAQDGTQLRLGLLSRAERGTILMLQGRTEYLEKYGQAARKFKDRGYGMVAVDFRGQGLSERFVPDSRIGHVARFTDYQQDVASLVAFAEAEAMPRPWVMVGHSMGGGIGLRAMLNGLPVACAVFSAPMWGINMPSVLRPVSYGLGWIAHKRRMDSWITPGMSRDVYAESADPTDNLLTHDPGMLAYMQAHLAAVPAMGLGGPSLPWLYRALMECRHLQRTAATPIPTLTFLPTEDDIICKASIRTLTARWPKARLIEVVGGAHETMMETPDRQQLFFTATADFFDTHRAATDTAPLLDR